MIFIISKRRKTKRDTAVYNYNRNIFLFCPIFCNIFDIQIYSHKDFGAIYRTRFFQRQFKFFYQQCNNRRSFGKYSTEERLRGLKPEERLKGLNPGEVFKNYKPEERLKGLNPEEIFKNYKPEDIVKYFPKEELKKCLGIE